MKRKYTLYIDESGDTGIEKVRVGIKDKGASPMLVIAGCLIPESRSEALSELLDEVRAVTSKKSLHCTGMGHLGVAKFSRMVAEKAGILCFALVSTKSTMGGFRDQISGKGQDQRYYNKCVSYFLERVGHYMLLNDISSKDVGIVFEEREGHDYEKLRNYLHTIKKNPLDKRLEYYLAPIDPNSITSVAKSGDDLLCFPDLVAFSVAAALNASAANFGVPEQRYLRELKDKFFCDERTRAVGEFGLKIFKRYELKLDEHTSHFVEKLHVSGIEPTLHDGGLY